MISSISPLMAAFLFLGIEGVEGCSLGGSKGYFLGVPKQGENPRTFSHLRAVFFDLGFSPQGSVY